jgi:hypothetical protein
LGNQALINNTTGSNNVAIGYQALLNTTTGSYQTVLGTNALSGNTTGSYHTAIGSGAGILNGFAGSYTSYIGYNAIPSGTGITNEIIVGGSATAGGTNVGYGNNSVALGNPSITKNILYGNVGIGTNSPIVALDVRGSYQQFGGNMSITNTTNGWSQVFVYSNGISGCGLFLNTSGRSTDGGTYTGTFRNDYGSIRLQGSGGYTTPTFGITVLPSGNVGINSNTPSNALDITGNVSISNQTNITSSINVINNIILNGTILNYSPIWTTNGTSIYTMNSVGINTSQPGSYALNIYGSVYLTGVLNVTGNITAVTASTNAINNPVTRNLNITCGSVYTGSMTCTDNGFTLIGDINTNYLTGTLNGGVAPVNLSYTNYPTLDLTRFTLDGNHVNAFPNSLYFTDATSTNQRDSGLLVSTDYNPTYIYSIGNKLYVQQLGLPTHGLYLNGSDANWYALSDRRVKTNIMPLSSMLLNVLSLNPVTFNYGKSTIDILDSSKNKNVGFIAQEVETIFPYCVSHETSDTSESPMLSITYELFIPYLIKAFQEEHTRIIKQEHQLNITTHHYNKIDITSIEHIHQSLLTNSERLDILEQKINLLMNTGVYT